MRVALLHHWYVTRGGGERVAECMAALFPNADLFSLLCDKASLPPSMQGRRVRTSFLQKVPGARRWHRHLMPLYPAATRSLDLRAYDLVLSSDSGPVKGARKREDAVQVCYCHSPMRYLYDGYEFYQRGMGRLVRRVFRMTAPRVRRFDLRSSANVTGFLSNSHYVAERIKRLYGRDSTVIYPPIDTSRGRTNPVGDHYLCAGRLVSYKRTEIMVLACEKLGRKLRVAGAGPEIKRLRKLAGPNTTFLGELTDEQLWDEYSRCKALLFAADEDFGMVPLEVQACGRPVIAFGFGGSLETVRADNPPTRYAPKSAEWDELAQTHPTGMYFTPQTGNALLRAILRFEEEERRFDPAVTQAFAAEFDTSVFLKKLRAYLSATVPGAETEMVSVEQALVTLRGMAAKPPAPVLG